MGVHSLKYVLVLFSLLLTPLVWADEGSFIAPPTEITESDGSPSCRATYTLKFPNGAVTDNGDGSCGVDVNALTSSLDGGSVISITNTDTDLASDTILVDTNFYTINDANGIFFRARSDVDGTPTTVFKLDQTAITSSIPMNFTGASGTAGYIKLFEDPNNGTNSTIIQTQAQAADITYNLPAAGATSNGAMLVNDALSPNGLSWSNVVTMSTNTLSFDTTRSDFVLSNDLILEDAHPALVFRGDGNMAYSLHLHNPASPSYANIALWKGTDTGGGFVIDSPWTPLWAGDTSNNFYIGSLGGGGTQCVQVDNQGKLSGVGSACGAASGDITSIGDVTSGAAFDGTQGTTLTFNDTDGDQTLAYDTSGNDFSLSDDLNITDATPHLDWIDSTGSQDDFEAYADQNQFHFSNKTDSVEIWQVTSANTFKVLQEASFIGNLGLAPAAAPTTSVAGHLAFDTNALGGTYRGAVQTSDGTSTVYLLGMLASDTPSNSQVPTFNTNGTVTWETPSAGSGDVTDVGDCTGSACFTGTAGTTLTFNDAAGDQTLLYNSGGDLDFNFSDDLNLRDGTPHLQWIDTTASEDDFEIYAEGSFFYRTNVTDSVVLDYFDASNAYHNLQPSSFEATPGVNGTTLTVNPILTATTGSQQFALNVNPTLSPASASTVEFMGMNLSLNTASANLSGASINAFQDSAVLNGAANVSTLDTHEIYLELNGTSTLSTYRGIHIDNPVKAAGATLTTNYGLLVNDQTAGTSDYGVAIDGADTQVLWLSSGADNTDAANGIAFGSSRDTTLYRSAANNLTIGGDLDLVDATPHLRWTPSSGDAFEIYAHGNQVYLTDVTTGGVLLQSIQGTGIRMPWLASCDTIDTDALGLLTCGTDATGAGGGDPVLIDGVAVGDASGVDLQGGTGIDITFNAGASPDTASFIIDNTELSSTTFGSGAFTTMTFDAGATDPVFTAGNGTFTIAPGGSDLIVVDDLELQDASPHLSLNPTSGDTFGFHVDPTVSTAFINNETDSVFYLHFGTGHQIDIGSSQGDTSLVPFVRITTDSTGNSEVQLPTDSIGVDELDTADSPADAESLTYQASTGRMVWTAGAGSGDITSVGDVTSGAAFDGTQGTVLTFNDADGDQTFGYNTTDNDFELTDDLGILQTTPHLEWRDTNADDFEAYADDNQFHFSNKTDSVEIWQVNSSNAFTVLRNTTFLGTYVALPFSTAPTPTVEGGMAWESDVNELVVGTEGSTVRVGKFPIVGGAVVNRSVDHYVMWGGGTSTSGEDTAATPFAMTCRNWHATVDDAPGAGNSWTVSLQLAGVNSALSCTISGASDTSCDLDGTDVEIPADTQIRGFFAEGGTANTTSSSTWSATCYPDDN